MNNQQAIQLIQSSDIGESEKLRLVKLIEQNGWNDVVRQEIVSVIQNEAASSKNLLDDVKSKAGVYGQYATKEQQIVEDAAGQMDQAVSDYNLELAKLEQEADQLKADAKKAE